MKNSKKNFLPPISKLFLLRFLSKIDKNGDHVMHTKVSVILPIYNQEKYLAKALTSLQNQTLKEAEFICVNDGSKDNSLTILNDYAAKDSRVK